jgi:hypothetical protein
MTIPNNNCLMFVPVDTWLFYHRHSRLIIIYYYYLLLLFIIIIYYYYSLLLFIVIIIYFIILFLLVIWIIIIIIIFIFLSYILVILFIIIFGLIIVYYYIWTPRWSVLWICCVSVCSRIPLLVGHPRPWVVHLVYSVLVCSCIPLFLVHLMWYIVCCVPLLNNIVNDDSQQALPLGYFIMIHCSRDLLNTTSSILLYEYYFETTCDCCFVITLRRPYWTTIRDPGIPGATKDQQTSG